MNLKQILTGGAAIFIGALIYLTDRSPGATYFVNHFLKHLSFHGNYPDFFGCLDKNMASFLHTFGFVMMTTGVAADTRKGCFIAAVFWGGVNVLFECGQYFDILITKYIPGCFEKIIVLETLDDFFLSGWFDLYDIMAIVFGACTGYYFSQLTLGRKTGRKKWRSAS